MFFKAEVQWLHPSSNRFSHEGRANVSKFGRFEREYSPMTLNSEQFEKSTDFRFLHSLKANENPDLTDAGSIKYSTPLRAKRMASKLPLFVPLFPKRKVSFKYTMFAPSSLFGTSMLLSLEIRWHHPLLKIDTLGGMLILSSIDLVKKSVSNVINFEPFEKFIVSGSLQPKKAELLIVVTRLVIVISLIDDQENANFPIVLMLFMDRSELSQISVITYSFGSCMTAR